jgi:hypothetical protein
MIAESILQGRLYALYYFNKKILYFMITIFVGAAALSATVMGSVLSGITAIAHPLPNVTFCVAFGIPSYFYTFWIPMLAFETVLCSLALYKGFQALVFDGSVYHSGRGLVHILIRDSVAYFLVMFATYLTNLLFWILAPEQLLEIPIGFSVAFSCVMGNRLILNIRQAGSEAAEPQDGTQFNPASSSFFTPSGALTEWEILEMSRMVMRPGHKMV